MITWRWCFILIKWCKMIQDDERSGTSWWNPTDACGTELMIHGNGSHSRYLSGPIKSWSFESFGLSSYIKLSCCFKLLTRKKKTICPAVSVVNMNHAELTASQDGVLLASYGTDSGHAFDLLGDIQLSIRMWRTWTGSQTTARNDWTRVTRVWMFEIVWILHNDPNGRPLAVAFGDLSVSTSLLLAWIPLKSSRKKLILIFRYSIPNSMNWNWLAQAQVTSDSYTEVPMGSWGCTQRIQSSLTMTQHWKPS